MKKLIIAFVISAASAVTSLPASAQWMHHNAKVDGATMYRTRNIVVNASNSPIHKTLVAAVKAAGLVDTLSGPGPFTVFAPTDDAFSKLPAGTVETLLKPENKATLAKILTYHVVAGKISSKQLEKMIHEGKGSATVTTVEGGKLTATLSGTNITLTDEKGGTAVVTIADEYQSNGIIHVVNNVLMPN